jgi:DNA-binding transcriptional LysR family regulator
MHEMNVASLDLNLLVALQALLEEESVGRAARRVGLSQPAMSHALSRLRSLLGDSLLVRVGAGMQLTVRGEALRHPVRDALERVQELLAGDTFDPSVTQRTFRICVADNASDLLLPPLLTRLRQVAPNIHLEIQPWRGRATDPAELARAVDAVVACVPDSFAGFYRQRLFRDRDACAVRQGHRAARRISEPEQFLNWKQVAVKPQGLFEDPVDTWLKQEGMRRNVVLTVPHYLQALHVVARSELIAVVPERLIRTYASRLKLKAMPVPLDVGSFDEYLLHPARTHTDAGCVWLRRVLKDIGRQLDSQSSARQLANPA